MAYLLLGGNLGDTSLIFAQARDSIAAQIGEIKKSSALYESEPWGMENAPWFINQAVKVATELDPAALLNKLLEIEMSLGRNRDPGAHTYASRAIDIDILYFEDQIIHLPGLSIPHPRIHLRRFALMAMNEIAPEKQHPEFETTQRALLKACSDKGIVRIL